MKALTLDWIISSYTLNLKWQGRRKMEYNVPLVEYTQSHTNNAGRSARDKLNERQWPTKRRRS